MISGIGLRWWNPLPVSEIAQDLNEEFTETDFDGFYQIEPLLAN
jgi:hypothetical protein